MGSKSQPRTLPLPGLPFAVHIGSLELEAIHVRAPVSDVSWQDSLMPTLMAALRDLGLVAIRSEGLADALAGVLTGKPYLLAQGTEPRHGHNGSIRCHFETDTVRKSWEAEDMGSADFRHMTDPAEVHRGQLIAEVVPATQAVPGMSVFGQPVAARTGREVHIVPGPNVVLEPSGRRAYAVEDGSAKLIGNRISVDPVKKIDGNVDFRSGCVEFVGDVIVMGDVLETFSVTAGGSIKVDGSVERASLKAGGEIVIAGGLYGKPGIRVEAEGNVSVGFAENAEIVTGGNLYVRSSMVNCSAIVEGTLHLKAAGKSLVGGHVIARRGVLAGSLGSPNLAARTIVEFGVDPKLVRELKSVETELAATNHPKYREALRARFDAIAEKLTQQAQGRVVARQVAHAGVELVNGSATYNITRDIAGMCFYRLPGKSDILMRTYTGGGRDKH